MKQLLIIIIVLTGCTLHAQTGGRYVFSYIDLVSSPRIAALGGTFVAIKDQDVNVASKSPSLIDDSINNHLSLSFTNFLTGINMGSFAYSHTFDKVGSFVTSMNYVNYGKFLYTDPTGEILGNFTAADYAYTIGWGRQLTPLFSIGSDIKFLYSKLETFNSLGLAIDLSANYISKDRGFCAVINSNYIGAQVKPYIEGQRYQLPFELQAGVTKKLRHLPFMFSFLLIHLEKYDLTFEDPSNPSSKKNLITGELETKSKVSRISDKLARHLVVGGELKIAKVLQLRMGYNYQRRQEMKINEKAGMIGFSFGMGLKIKGFQIDYAFSKYHLAGSPNYLSITKNLNEIIRKQ